MATLNNRGVDITPNSLPRQMASAVAAWLDYNSSVCGEIGVQENMINQPIKAFSIFHQNDYVFQFEKQHPYLSPKCHVDLYMKMKAFEMEYFFEFKQAKAATSGINERSRIFNDIVRLSSLVSENRRCFFLIFGTGTSFKENFLEYRYPKKKKSDKKTFIKEHNAQEVNIGVPFYSRWFSFSAEDKDLYEKEISVVSDKYYFEKFKKEYLIKKELQNESKANPPKTIVTKRIYLKYKDSINGVGLWEIKAKE